MLTLYQRRNEADMKSQFPNEFVNPWIPKFEDDHDNSSYEFRFCFEKYFLSECHLEPTEALLKYFLSESDLEPAEALFLPFHFFAIISASPLYGPQKFKIMCTLLFPRLSSNKISWFYMQLFFLKQNGVWTYFLLGMWSVASLESWKPLLSHPTNFYSHAQ